jgi:hypothetical protein
VRIGEASNWDELVAACDQAVTRRKMRRRAFEVVWWNNIALVVGDHFSTWNPNTATFEDRDPTFTGRLDNKKPRLVINHGLSIARTELAKLTKSDPIMEVLANSDESVDLAAAKVSESVLEALEWKFRLQKMRKQAFWWMIQTGISSTYVGYDHLDDTDGEYQFVIDPATGEPTFNPGRIRELREMVTEGVLPKLDEERFPLGDLEYKTYSPFQLLPDEVATDFSEINDLITEDVVDVDVAKGIYGRAAKDLTPSSNLKIGTIEQRMIATSGIVGGLGTDKLSGLVENGCRIYTFWLKPNVYRGNAFLKNGVMLRWADNRKILQKSKIFPYVDGRIPHTFWQHIPTSTTIWPDSVISHIRGPNLEIDKTMSQLIENKDYMSNPMWLVATQHRIKGDIKNVAGSIVRYRHSANIPPPARIDGTPMPQQAENLVASLYEQILYVSGQGDVSHGKVPTGVRSGVAVAYMQEEDDTKIAPTIENMEDGVALMGSLSLERVSQFYTVQRTLRYYRRDGTFDVLKFKGADLKNTTDVVCQAGSMMPRMKAARQQYVLELVSLGILTDPDEISEMLEIGYGDPDDKHKSKAQATRENNYMLYGMPGYLFHPDGADGSAPPELLQKVQAAIPVKSWQDHATHIQVHRHVMMDEEFDIMAITRPEIVRLFDEHVAMHEQAQAAQQQQQMQMLMAAKGAPDGPPGQASTPAGTGGGMNGSTLGVIAQTAQPDVIGGGSLALKSRNKIPQGTGSG